MDTDDLVQATRPAIKLEADMGEHVAESNAKCCDSPQHVIMSRSTGRLFTIDTSRAKTNAQVVSLCAQKLGIKEYKQLDQRSNSKQIWVSMSQNRMQNAGHDSPQHVIMSRSTGRLFTIDTSRAKTNAQVVSLCAQKLGIKEIGSPKIPALTLSPTCVTRFQISALTLSPTYVIRFQTFVAFKTFCYWLLVRVNHDFYKWQEQST
ncbi:hypothetical protein Tcan_10431 [Toxocara canis]|uniref:Uncharacterized protein n=1 Tax=Toxocara canis TaxID=6265 RepID=A0A0B2V131_TOXCA|nr:hypothetical protein Tcan_10431 [Toxocara canis]